jgi:hypothetical protein
MSMNAIVASESASMTHSPLTRPDDYDLAAAYTQAVRAVLNAGASQSVIHEQLNWFFDAFQAAPNEDMQLSLCYGVMAWARGL